MSKMAKKYLRRVSEFLVIRDMQVKTVLRFYLSPVRMARVKKQLAANTREDAGKRHPHSLLVTLQRAAFTAINMEKS